MDQEEYGEPQIDDSLRNPGELFYLVCHFAFLCVKNNNRCTTSPTDDAAGVWGGRRDSTCSFYQPPPPSDIERMRNNVIKEQKVFGLMREILGRRTNLTTYKAA